MKVLHWKCPNCAFHTIVVLLIGEFWVIGECAQCLRKFRFDKEDVIKKIQEHE